MRIQLRGLAANSACILATVFLGAALPLWPLWAQAVAAAEDKDLAVRKAAVAKLTDQAALARVGERDRDESVRMAAISSLTDRAFLTKFAQMSDDHIRHIADLRLFLTDPIIEGRIGATKLSISRNLISQGYDVGVIPRLGTLGAHTVMGETITATVSGGKLDSERTHTWSSKFPLTTKSVGFQPAELDIAEFVQDLLKRFPQTELARLVVEYKNSAVREGAIRDVTDQAVLAKAAVEDTDSRVRAWAVAELKDEALVAKAAVEDKDSFVRVTAAYNHILTDQAALAKVAVSDENTQAQVGKEALRKLTDPVLQAKVALEAKDPQVRSYALDSILDQTVLAKAATEDKNDSVRGEAILRLTDKAVLGKVATKDKVEWVRRRAQEQLNRLP